MLFNSYNFLLIYLPFVLIGFFCFARLHLTLAARSWLFASSLLFYGYWDIRFIPLLLGSILFNFSCGYRILSVDKPLSKKMILAAGIVSDLTLLFYFKYYHFFISNFLPDYALAETILPLGISFFTFTQIAYLVDAYQNKATKSDLVSYGLFVTIFPHLIAGPILHHKEMLKQFNSLRMYVVSWPNIGHGTFLFVLGLFKKVIIADKLANLVRPIFDQSVEPVPFVQAWLGALSYTLQLYFDFSGYSDMAVGLGLLFSLHLPINFNSPYKADSIIEFWKRWHITLSQFLRDYLYIPLGGNRKGKWAKMRNLFITMVLGGLWHGAGWTFIIWGACHGLFLTINHLWRDLKLNMPNWLARSLTLVAIICAWVIFRSPNMDKAVDILAGMVGLNGIILPESYEASFAFLKKLGFVFGHVYESKFKIYHILIIGVLSLVVLLLPNSNEWTDRFKKRPVVWSFVCAFLFLACFFNLSEASEFLYYQF